MRNRIYFPVVLTLLTVLLTTSARAQNQTLYTDTLLNGWQNWSWATVNPANASPVHLGTSSVSVSSTNWQAFFLHHTAQNMAGYTNLTFWVNGGSGGQVIQLQALRNGVAQTAVVLAPLPTNSWRQETISLSALGVASAADLDGFWWQVQNSGLAPTFYVDDITLVTNGTPAPAITLTSPANNSSLAAPATISFAATVVTNGHTITKVQFYNGASLLNEDALPPYSFSWTNVGVGSFSVFARLIYDASASLDSSAAGVTVTGISPVSINVNAHSNAHPINPLIYGVAFATTSQLLDLNSPLNRSGGNSETRYNWQLNAHNRAADYYFESIGDSPATPGAAADDHITTSKNGGAQPLISIPMIGWMPKLQPNRDKLASFSIAKYGAQTGSDSQWMPDAGNGVSSVGNTNIINDPNDANFLTNSAFQQAFVRHLTNLFGMSTNGGVRYYIMDNEHSIWHSTHRDVHPIGASMEEIRDKMFEYGSMVKSNDPNAIVLGPEEFGWSGYLYSGYDLWYTGLHGYSVWPDRAAHGNMDYMPWLLDQYRQRSLTNSQRVLDYFTLHCYPEDGNVAGNATDNATQLLRNRLTRKFWDTTYVDDTWIGSQAPPYNIVKLIPRMKGWVTNYPGTKLGITEYNWGAEAHINGATAQADIMGIFGRENLDLATRWTTPDASTPTYKAMKLYRNYDGNKSTFGDTSVSATVPNPDNVSAFAAVRSTDGALTVMVINKQLTTAALATIATTNFTPNGNAQVWQLTSANAITRLSDLTFSGNTFSNVVPAQSITLFIVTNAPNPPVITNQPQSLAAVPGGSATFAVGVSGQSPFSYQWRTNGTAITGKTSATLLLSNLQPANFAGYSVLVTNTSGPVISATAQLSMAVSPMIVSPNFNTSLFRLTFPTEIGPSYDVEYKTKLTDPTWQVLTNVTGSGLSATITNSSGTNTTKFYRIHLR